nr:hypothetical protein [Bacillus sp. FJAT-50079]
MKKAIVLLTFIFIGLLIIGSFPSIINACSCAELPSVEEEFERSKAVFSGKVIDIREKQSLDGYTSNSVQFEVTNTWKGVEQSQIIITTGLGGGDCGFDFKEGKEYLVYAYESTMYGEESLVSIICGRTNKLSSSQEDLALLGEGKPPSEGIGEIKKIEEVEEIVDIELPGDEHEENQLYIWIAAVLVIGIVMIFAIKSRKGSNNKGK